MSQQHVYIDITLPFIAVLGPARVVAKEGSNVTDHWLLS